MVFGVGVDLVDVTRFEEHLERTPKLRERLFTPVELEGSAQSIAARFAAKEALVKALGSPAGLNWQEIEITKNMSGKPEIKTVGISASTVAAAGISKLHLSISHDGGMAIAMVVAE